LANPELSPVRSLAINQLWLLPGDASEHFRALTETKSMTEIAAIALRLFDKNPRIIDARKREMVRGRGFEPLTPTVSR
jgi:hypothetical protein